MLRIAFRNLFRQKRRNFLLGSAIAIGTMLLIVAHSFSHGISNTLINEVVAYVAGHANVGFAHEGQLMSQVLRGGAHWKEKIEKIPGVKKVEPTMGIMGRIIGNGKSDNAFLVALNMHQNFTAEESLKTQNNFPMVKGSWDKLKDNTIENPLILSEAKAKYLNVDLGDILRVRMQDFSGQFQAARLTVVGIFQPSNMFMETAMFLEYRDMSRLMGLRSEDSPYLYLTIDNPAKNAVRIADEIWEMMKPSLAALPTDQGLFIPFKGESIAKGKLAAILGIDTTLLQRRSVLVNSTYAKSKGWAIGDTIRSQYAMRFPDSLRNSNSYRGIITGFYETRPHLPPEAILVHEASFYSTYYDALPKSVAPVLQAPWKDVLGTEWDRLPRARTTEELQNIRREISSGKHKATTLTVDSMYESASSVLQLENALQLITASAVLVIFFIILIGVVNTLRMTVRERTREIGTLRAIGMQQSDVRKVFLYETGLLAFISACFGTILAFIVMTLLSSLTIPSAGNPLGMILVNNHLVFSPTIMSILSFILLIIGLALATAFFPAQRAARLPAATALRHYE